MNNVKFTGIMPALITPIGENGEVKRDTVKALMDYQCKSGVDGFYICGNTGEGPVIGAAARMEMAETVMENKSGQCVVINHVGAAAFEEVCELVRHANEIGVDAISSLPPTSYYNYTDDEIVDYYKKIASMTDKPVLVYANNMLKTADLTHLAERFMEIPNVIGLKYTRQDYFEFRKIKEINNGDINMINGPDETLICGLIMGADGGMGSTYNIMPKWFAELYKSFRNGDFETAREMQYKINRVINVLLKHSQNGAIKAIKEALKLMGFDAGNTTYPAKMYTKEETERLKTDLAAAGFIVSEEC